MLSQKPSRALIVGFVVATIGLVVVSLGAASYYNSSSSALLSKDKQILELHLAILAENASILTLELNQLSLSQNITSLQERILGLLQNQITSSATITALTGQIQRLENESARMALEIFILQQVSKLSILTYYYNNTVTVAPGSTTLVTSQANGHNGTLVFVSSSGCPGKGDSVQSTSPTYVLYLLLDPSGPPTYSVYVAVAGQPFTFSFKNIGSTPETCTFSLFYVQH